MDLWTLFVYSLIPGVFIFILYFVMRAAVKSVIDEKLEEIKKAFRNEVESNEKK